MPATRCQHLLGPGFVTKAMGVNIHAPNRLGSGRSLTTLGFAVLIAWSACSVLGEEELLVGHNAAGQLIVRVEFELPFGLPVSVFPGLPGFATGEVGMHSAAFDEPTNDFFELSPAADFRFILLATKDPGVEVLNDHGSAYMQVGESFFIGVAPFDTHPLWDIVSGVPRKSYSLTIQLHDLNAVYADSVPVVLIFTPMPPVLSVVPGAPGFITISWTPATTGSGLVLQSSPAISPLNWSNVPSGATNPVTLPAVAGAMFYRLSK